MFELHCYTNKWYIEYIQLCTDDRIGVYTVHILHIYIHILHTRSEYAAFSLRKFLNNLDLFKGITFKQKLKVSSLQSLFTCGHNVYYCRCPIQHADPLEDQPWCQVRQKQIFIIWQHRCLVCAAYVDVCLFAAPVSKGLRGLGGWRGGGGCA